jgi:hypothetical protein
MGDPSRTFNEFAVCSKSVDFDLLVRNDFASKIEISIDRADVNVEVQVGGPFFLSILRN